MGLFPHKANDLYPRVSGAQDDIGGLEESSTTSAGSFSLARGLQITPVESRDKVYGIVRCFSTNRQEGSDCPDQR